MSKGKDNVKFLIVTGVLMTAAVLVAKFQNQQEIISQETRFEFSDEGKELLKEWGKQLSHY